MTVKDEPVDGVVAMTALIEEAVQFEPLPAFPGALSHLRPMSVSSP